MKICLTGSQGFIGQHLAKALKENKKVELLGCDLPKADLLRPASLAKFVAKQEVIIHAAAVNRGSNTAVIAGSVVATYNLLEALKKAQSRAKIVYLSSTHAENDSPYGLSKRLVETMLADYAQEQKIPVVALRLVNVFGEGGRPFYNSVVHTFCYQAARGEKLTIKNGQRKISFIYVEDAIKAILKEVFQPGKQLFYLKKISSTNEISINELAKLIKSFPKVKNSKELKQRFHKNLYKTYLSLSQ
ncbi:MAG: NAD-dependent epimerase/dehydratase family protein [Patescibacteria group bacterium]